MQYKAGLSWALPQMAAGQTSSPRMMTVAGRSGWSVRPSMEIGTTSRWWGNSTPPHPTPPQKYILPHTPLTDLKKCQNFSETITILSFLDPIQTLTISEWFWRLRNTVRIDTNRFWTGLIIPNLPNSTFPKWEIWESGNLKIWKRRAPKHNR